MSIYTSQGTIGVRCTTCGVVTVYFVPEKDYSIKHRNEDYAVFVPQPCDCSDQCCGCKMKCCKRAIITKYDRDKGYKIEMSANKIVCKHMDVILAAASQGYKVQVEVKLKVSRVLEAATKIEFAMQKFERCCKAEIDNGALKNAAEEAKAAADALKNAAEEANAAADALKKAAEEAKAAADALKDAAEEANAAAEEANAAADALKNAAEEAKNKLRAAAEAAKKAACKQQYFNLVGITTHAN